jgi:hypothetical protein
VSGFAPFRVLPFGCSRSFQTSFPHQLSSCALGLVLTTSASTVSSASSILALLSIGLVVNVSPYLISLSLILSYHISLSYLIAPLFIVWRWSHPRPQVVAYLYSLSCLTQVNMVRALVCALLSRWPCHHTLFLFTRLQHAQLNNNPYLSFLKPPHEITRQEDEHKTQ